MKDWLSYIKECSNTELWGFVCLDYYNKLAGDKRQAPSVFIDEILNAVAMVKVDPVSFHEVLVCVCVQLLGSDFDATMDKSMRFLEPRIQDLTMEQLKAVVSHYVVYGKAPLIIERLEKVRPGIQGLSVTTTNSADNTLKGKTHAMTTPGNEAFLLFYSYAHEDEKMRDKLAKHLNLLKRQLHH